jgi:hypothetical protein
LAKDLTTRDLKIQLIAKKTNGKSFELVTDKILVDSHSPKLDFSTNPVLSNSSKSVVYAGEKVIINWSATDGIGSGISNVSLKVPNVSGGMSTVVLSGGAGSYEFIVPNISKSSAKIELTATDSVVLEDGVVGHTSVLPTPFFEINNSIPANAPSIALISPVPPSTSTFLRKVDGSITDCRTNHFYLVSLSATKPASTDSGFKPCSVGTLFSQPLPADGPQSVYIWGRKGTSLVSNTSVKVDVNVDTTPIGKPSVPTPALAAFYKATPISVALSGCPLNSKVLVSETNTGFATAPLESDSRWVVCGSSVAFNPPSPPLSEGPHSL